MSNAARPDDIALLRGMLDIPSLSGQERPLAEYLCAEMARRGLRAHIDAAGNAVGEIGASGPLVVLLGHMDTAAGVVPVRQEGDLLYGRGSVDAKGPLAAFICAAARLGPRADVRLAVVGAVEEESATSRGARHVARTYRPDACVIGEPSRWDRVTLGYKGRLLVDYTTQQGSAHTAGAVPTASERAVAFWNGVVAICEEAGGAKEFARLSPTLRRIHGESDGLRDSARLALSLRLPPALDTIALRTRRRHGDLLGRRTGLPRAQEYGAGARLPLRDQGTGRDACVRAQDRHLGHEHRRAGVGLSHPRLRTWRLRARPHAGRAHQPR
jgi:LysW-gamma-L-lysine carboxypeptidase